MTTDSRRSTSMRLGFACHWDPDPPSTWSGTPWRLLAALEEHAQVVELDPRLPTSLQHALRYAHVRRRNGAWTSPWRTSGLTRKMVERRVRRASSGVPCDAVLQIGDLAPFESPYFIYQDLSYDVLLRHFDDPAGTALQFPTLSRRALDRARERQHALYEQATGVLAMSSWFAKTLVEWSGLPENKVHVVRPGACASADAGRVLASPTAPVARSSRHNRRHLLFLGKDFQRKGGDLVLKALQQLRDGGKTGLTLTVVGPRSWPLPTPIPDGVLFLGRIPTSQVAELFAAHDLLVVPSRFEAFGIVFLEALTHGLPCIGRDAFAMPEIIMPGHNGSLVTTEEPGELATRILDVLSNDTIYETCEQETETLRRRYSWERAATETIGAIRGSLDTATV